VPVALPCGVSVVVVAAVGVVVVWFDRFGAQVTRYRSFGGGGGGSSCGARSGRDGEASWWLAAAQGAIGQRLASATVKADPSAAGTRRQVLVRRGVGRVFRQGKDGGKSLMR
jgi:hypothetical protein